MNEKTANEFLKKVKACYNKIAEEFDTSRQHNWKEFEIILPYIKDGDKITDLGCGNGRLYTFLKRNKEIHYTGIDNSKKLLEAARKQHGEAKFLDGDLLKIPLKEKSQDAAIAIASFHHIPSERLRIKALKEIKRILKPNGRLILTVWNLFQPKYKKYIWKSRLKSFLRFGKFDSRDTFIPWGNRKTMRYYYAFKPKEIEELITENGFRVQEKKVGNNISLICQKS